MSHFYKLLGISLLLVGCATFAPKPGMTVQELNSMSALSMNQNLVSLGKNNILNADVYETGSQNYKRLRNFTPPEGGWQYFYFQNGRLMDQKNIQAILTQQAEAQKKAEADRQAAQKKAEADRQAALAKQQKDATEKAVKQKEQQKTLNKLNEM